MSGIVAKVKDGVPAASQTPKCDKDNCSVSMKGAPRQRVIVDMDCNQLSIQGSRCDYLFVSEDESSAWVVPIEMKSGRIKEGKLKDQLQGGAQFAQALLAEEDQFSFVPVLAYGKPIGSFKMKELRKVRITFPGKRPQQLILIKCGDPLPMFC